jgi:hypothetical protein
LIAGAGPDTLQGFPPIVAGRHTWRKPDMASIRVSQSGRYFIDEHGEPFFWLGDTQWELFRCFSTEDARTIIERRRAQGFTILQIMVTGLGEGDRPNADGHVPWHGGNPAVPNEAFFAGVDRVVEAISAAGLIGVLGVYHKVQKEHLTCENTRAYARWVAARYAGEPSIVWSMYPEAKEEYIPVIRELAAGLREGDGGAHMITLHPDPSPASSSFIHREEWLDFNSMQPCLDYERIHEMVSHDYALEPTKPVVMAEGGYEGINLGRLQTPLEIRKQAYWSYLAGGFHSYAHDDSNSAPAEWRRWIDSPGARHLGVCRAVLTGLREWWDLVPDQSLIAEGEGEGIDLNVAARSAAGHWALLYLVSSATVGVRMDGLVAGRAARATWVDPTTGARSEAGTAQTAGTIGFTTPEGWADALLLLEPDEER